MQDIAPQIVRQRLLIECTYTIAVDRQKVQEYLLGLTQHLNLRVYGEPIIHSPGGEGKEINQGFDAFIPLIDSGIALYVWSNEKFMSCVIYTCKHFSVDSAVQFTKDFFVSQNLVSEEF
jgi:S-adenosylmethionine/arginine decarboxylase-like enzyme